MEANQIPPHLDKSSSLLTTVFFLVISSVIFYLIYKLFFKSSKGKSKNSLLLIGPAQSGKTSFFYYVTSSPNLKLLGKDQIQTVTSMQINEVHGFQSKLLSNDYDVVDIPGLGFFKDTIIQRLPEAKLIVLFVDSSERASIFAAGEYLYDILNSDKFNEDIPMVITCNKQDLNFPKTKKMVENDLASEIENIKTIKQKNNLDDREQIGPLFQMKKKFAFAAYKNISFVETDKKSSFASLLQHIKEVLLENKHK